MFSSFKSSLVFTKTEGIDIKEEDSPQRRMEVEVRESAISRMIICEKGLDKYIEMATVDITTRDSLLYFPRNSRFYNALMHYHNCFTDVQRNKLAVHKMLIRRNNKIIKIQAIKEKVACLAV
jgi:hypothetical protein